MDLSKLQSLISQKKSELSRNSSTEKLGPGTTKLRVMGTWRGDGEPLAISHNYGQHFVKAADGSVLAVYVCQSKTYQKPCPVCEAIAAGTARAGSEEQKALLKEASAGQRYLINAIAVESNPGEVKVYDIPGTVFEGILSVAQQYLKEADKSIFGSDGVDLNITREGTGVTTKYTVAASLRSTTVNTSMDKKVVDLDKFVVQETAERERKALTSVSSIAGVSLGMSASMTGLIAPSRSADTPTPIPGRTAAEEMGASVAPWEAEAVTDVPSAASAEDAAADMDDPELRKLLEGL